MKESTPSPESLQGADAITSAQSEPHTQAQFKLDKCDTLLDLLEEDGTTGVSSKETTAASTAYPEFGHVRADRDETGKYVTLQIRICHTELAHTTVAELKSGDILTSDEPVGQTVEILWQQQVIGKGYLKAIDEQYVVEITELQPFDSQGNVQGEYGYDI